MNIENGRSLKQLMNMSGRVCLITGGAGHIGVAMADALAELGATIILLDRNTKEMAKAEDYLAMRHHTDVGTIYCDLENDDEVKLVAPTIIKRYEKLDVLINNAAFVGSADLEGWSTNFEDQNLDTWRRAMNVNLTSAFALTQECKKLLDVSGKGSVINIGSIYGEYAPDPSLYAGTKMQNPAAYSASKGGLLQLTRWLSTILAPKIRVNAMSPGGVSRHQPKAFIDRYEAKTPLGRMGQEEDFKGAVAFLASDLSSWVTGQNIKVDGGWGFGDLSCISI